MLIFEYESDIYLYHYTKASTAIDYILKNKNLQLGSMLNTNDPKESKNWLFELGTNENADLDKYDLFDTSSKVDFIIKSSTYMLCFTKDKELTGDHIQDITKRGYGHSRMWAQYAANHTGICLIFEKKLLEKSFIATFNSYTYFMQDVKYIDRFIGERDSAYIVNVDYLEKLGLEDYALAHAETYKNRLFFEKLEDWKNENEYRLILQGYKNKQLLFPYEHSLKGIVFGASCSEADIQNIVDLTHNMGIEYIQLKWRNCSPWYDFRKVFVKSNQL
ncbi:DUF2971 domain-containing protein [Acinetobacter baumannii]|jgi:hypothetical protein|uniref:DUF2971 domain-containing protein n=1 Tax=Acinetobacter TaxID=469 RepID=UPI0007083A3A|nr:MULTISPECIES: DUF2971 domain-containing protein [Acinetobacter]EHU1305756.1 DUF2971 domain-containing protein [Acinetobacter baumannii]EHU1429011.1 DUF2971 domain-containing protein [Acinetobacter baumannii]EHU2160102.1 DUF2971 domain-containing protein [Acinetobacter baumannii]EHU2440368.1 DUF2971 domain-containing protein [Acinetobacter baumannii]EIB6848800.1 DUF2971 domain-containing protein [Acinetobacter baumannii]